MQVQTLETLPPLMQPTIRLFLSTGSCDLRRPLYNTARHAQGTPWNWSVSRSATSPLERRSLRMSGVTASLISQPRVASQSASLLCRGLQQTVPWSDLGDRGYIEIGKTAHAPPPRDLSWKVHMEITMIRLIAVGFALAVATSAQAMSPAPLHQPDGMITHVRSNCGAGMRLE